MTQITRLKLVISGSSWSASYLDAILGMSLQNDSGSDFALQFPLGGLWFSGEPLVSVTYPVFGPLPSMGGVERVSPFSIEYVFAVPTGMSADAFFDSSPVRSFHLEGYSFGSLPDLNIELQNSIDGVSYRVIGNGAIGAGVGLGANRIDIEDWEGPPPGAPVFWTAFVRTREVRRA